MSITNLTNSFSTIFLPYFFIIYRTKQQQRIDVIFLNENKTIIKIFQNICYLNGIKMMIRCCNFIIVNVKLYSECFTALIHTLLFCVNAPIG